MLFSKPLAYAEFEERLRELFYERSLICLWLAVIFFSLFSVLDFIVCRQFFNLFFMYRLVFVAIVLGFIHLLKLPPFIPYAPLFMYATMLLGTLAISLMTVQLGGFTSGYYVGILLIVAGGLSVLILNSWQAFFTGFSMYVVYIATVLLSAGNTDHLQLAFAANNSFFFFFIVWVTTVQSFDDLKSHVNELRMNKSIQALRQELTLYTDDLEDTIQKRLAALEESKLRYRDLYNSMLDLVVLIDDRGTIRKINQHCVSQLALQPQDLEGTNIEAVMHPANGDASWFSEILALLDSGRSIRGMQLQLRNRSGKTLDIELSANHASVDENNHYLLILRDISATKKMERDLLDSERLIDTSRQSAIFGLAKLAECRDTDTGSHLSRIQSYTRVLTLDLAKTPEFGNVIGDTFIEDILRSCVLHDIGKVGIPDSILLKPGKLTDSEYEHMKQHCVFGSDTLLAAEKGVENLSFLNVAREIARSHHERWDGKGYPDGLSGTDIPLAARIISVADVYDALTSRRVYKAAFTHKDARDIILKESGKQFDPKIVDAFLRTEHEFKEIRMQLLLQQPDQNA